MLTRDPTVWIMRLAWFLLPVTPGPEIASTLDEAQRSSQLVGSSLLWAGWAIGLVAVFFAHPVSLTVIRVLGPAALGLSVAAAVDGHPAAAGVGFAAVAAATALLPAIGRWGVNGSAYGDEVRFPLRAPAPLYLVAPAAGAACVAGLAIPAMLFAAQRWVAGACAVPLLAAPWFLGRALYRLALRWAVLVPAGLVLHDPMALREPVLFRRQRIAGLRAAPADSDAVDLTLNAAGLALELDLAEQHPIVKVVPRGDDEAGKARRLLFVPTEPGRLLGTAASRGIPTG